MGSVDAGTSEPSSAREDVILKYRPSLKDGPFFRNLPGVLYSVALAFSVVYGVAGGGLPGVVLAVLAAAVGCWVLNTLSAPSVSVVVRADSVSFLHGLSKPDVRLDEIAKVKIALHSEWVEARVALKRKGVKKRTFFTFRLKSDEMPLPGDERFQAEVVGEILKRRGDIPIDEDAARLLTGKLGLPWKHRLPLVMASGVAAAITVYLLVVSIWWLAAPILVVAGAQATGAFSASAMCLKRESWGRSAVASLGLGVAAALLIVFGVATLYGYTEYMPLAYAAGVVFCTAGLLASLPLGIRPLHLVAGEAVVALVLVAVTWSVTIRGTIPVRQVSLAPSPMEARFSPDGNAVIADGMADGRHAVHFVDRHSMRSSTVYVHFQVMLPVPVGEDMALCINSRPRGRERELWLIRAASDPVRVAVGGVAGVLSPDALSPGGREFALFVSEGKGTDRPTCRLHVLDLGTTEVREGGPGLDHNPDHGYLLTWRPDGRLAWADGTLSGEGDGRFQLWSWKPGEESARLEFESAEKWSDVTCSPGLKKALASVHTASGKIASIVDLSDGNRISVPGLFPHGRPRSGLQWTADADLCAWILEADPRSVMVIDTGTGRSTVVRGPAPGRIGGVAISPNGKYIAFSMKGSAWSFASAVYVSNLETGTTRRLRPLPGLGGFFSLGWQGTGAWSPTGDGLAVAVYAFPATAYVAEDAGAVWLVDQLP